MNTDGFWVIFSLSFLTALSGALAPGPLLTYTITHSIRDSRRGYLAGVSVIGGHAVLETGILIAIVLGFSSFLNNPVFRYTVSIIGCLFLLFFGVSLIISVVRGKFSSDFLDGVPSHGQQVADAAARPAAGAPASRAPSKHMLDHPVLGGILVSMSNPYWWIWWATIGTTFFARFGITTSQPDRIIAFFFGHIAGDLAWYGPVSAVANLCRKIINRRIYGGVLVVCGAFMAGLAVFLGASQFQR